MLTLDMSAGSVACRAQDMEFSAAKFQSEHMQVVDSAKQAFQAYILYTILVAVCKLRVSSQQAYKLFNLSYR